MYWSLRVGGTSLLREGIGVVPSWIPLLSAVRWAGVYCVCNRQLIVHMFAEVGVSLQLMSQVVPGD